jgi:predicted dienelactone hydrolase
MIRISPRTRHSVGAFAVAVALLGAGCGGDDDCCFIRKPLPDPASQAAYVAAGPYPVGVVALQLPDRRVEVWYPGAPGSEAGLPRDTYRQTDPITDPILKSFAENIARREGINLVYETRAFRDLPPSGAGPFPLLLLSHGFGGWRNINSSLAAGIASWGFVVASADYLERGLNAVATNTVNSSPEKDVMITTDTLALLRAEDAAPESALNGLIDFERIGVAGHSAGGRTALETLAEPDIDVAVGYAAAGGAGNGGKPAMLIAARNDIGVTTEDTEALYASLSSPKRVIFIEQSGHNSFSDVCTPIREGASLAQLARQAGLQIDERLLALAENGCAPEDLAPEDAWAIAQHFTVAQLRAAFGIDEPPVGLGAGVADKFVVTVEYRQE